MLTGTKPASVWNVSPRAYWMANMIPRECLMFRLSEVYTVGSQNKDLFHCSESLAAIFELYLWILINFVCITLNAVSRALIRFHYNCNMYFICSYIEKLMKSLFILGELVSCWTSGTFLNSLVNVMMGEICTCYCCGLF